MLIQILGTGCAKCKTLMANAQQAVSELGLQAQIEKVEDIQQIVKMGVMATPALAIDGQVKVAGKVVPAEQIKKLLG